MGSDDHHSLGQRDGRGGLAEDLPLGGLVGEPVADLELHREDAALC